MRHAGLAMALVGAALAAGPGPAADAADAERTLARVNGEPISLADLLDTLAEVHGEVDSPVRRPPNDPAAVLDRLITTKLVAQEARTMGFDELAAFRDELAAFRRRTLIDLTLQRAARTVTAPEPAAVERLYRIAVAEVRLDALFFEDKAEAERFLGRLSEVSFEAARDAALADGSARGGSAPETVKLAELHPALAAVVADLATGVVSRAVPLEGGAAVLRVVDLQLPDDDAARAQAEREALEAARLRAVGAYVARLEAEHARTDGELLQSLDFDVDQTAFDKLLADKRPLVTIAGAEPVTVADLAAALKMTFFHGMDNAARTKKVSLRRDDALHDLVVKRLALVEAGRLRVEDSPEFRRALQSEEEQMLFDAAVQRVILPELRIAEEDIASYYEAHAMDYPAPRIVDLEAVAFADRADAERTLEQLRRGADWRWAVANAAGRLAAEELPAEGSLAGKQFLDTLPEDVRASVRAQGDMFVHGPEGGPVWLLAVRELPPPRPLELERVRGAIEGRLQRQAAQQALDQWSAQLRAASTVEQLVEPEELRRLVAGS